MIFRKWSEIKFTHRPMFLFDKWSHKLHFPKPIQHRICNAYEQWLGMSDDEIRRVDLRGVDESEDHW